MTFPPRAAGPNVLNGRCMRGDGCVCHYMVQIFCPDWKACERLPGALEVSSILQWMTLPDTVRHSCVEHLRKRILEVDQGHVIDKWRDQYARGVVIGSDDVRFHFGAGMVVRNTLREVLPDEAVPTQNWDDVYYGCLNALATGERREIGPHRHDEK